MRVMRVFVPLLAVLAACGAPKQQTPDDAGSGYSGNFAIQGVPHSGQYTECTLSQSTGAASVLSCTGTTAGCSQDGQTGCGLSVLVPLAPGTYDCAHGTSSVVVWDPTLPANLAGMHPANAGCQPTSSGTPPGQPVPGCPNDTTTGCNRVLGSCTLTVTAATPQGQGAPSGHFSGTLDATVYTDIQYPDCNGYSGAAVQGAGQSYTLHAAGAF